MIQISLTSTTWPLMRRLLRKSWLKFATGKAARRKETAGESAFDRTITARTIAKLPTELQHTACLQIAGGYQSDARKAKWVPDNKGLCAFCGQYAPFRHILFECTQMREVYSAEGKPDLLQSRRPDLESTYRS